MKHSLSWIALSLSLSLWLVGPAALAAPPPAEAPPASPPTAQPVPQHPRLQAVQNVMTIDAGSGRVIQLGGGAASVFAADPKVAEVRPASATSLFIFGVTPGRTRSRHSMPPARRSRSTT
jgi:pilus assembly protein CpaC